MFAILTLQVYSLMFALIYTQPVFTSTCNVLKVLLILKKRVLKKTVRKKSYMFLKLHHASKLAHLQIIAPFPFSHSKPLSNPVACPCAEYLLRLFLRKGGGDPERRHLMILFPTPVALAGTAPLTLTSSSTSVQN